MTAHYLVRRLVQVPAAVLGILAVAFLLVHLAPGDPILALAGEQGDAAYYSEMRAKFGLDRPLAEQFTSFADNLLRLDLGTSYVHGRPALDVVLERVPSTLLLTGSAFLLSTTLGIGLGLLAAAHARRREDVAVSVVTLTLQAMPSFWLGQLAILALGLTAGWFPIGGLTSPRSTATGLGALVDVGHHLVLPAGVLAAAEVAVVARLTRAGLLDELSQNYVRTARAKGLPERQVLGRHALRRALLPVVTVIGSRAGHLLSGAVVVEAVFGWPGLGRLLVASVQARDTPIVLSIFLLVAIGVVLANLATDLVYARLDPRIRLG